MAAADFDDDDDGAAADFAASLAAAVSAVPDLVELGKLDAAAAAAAAAACHCLNHVEDAVLSFGELALAAPLLAVEPPPPHHQMWWYSSSAIADSTLHQHFCNSTADWDHFQTAIDVPDPPNPSLTVEPTYPTAENHIPLTRIDPVADPPTVPTIDIPPSVTQNHPDLNPNNPEYQSLHNPEKVLSSCLQPPAAA